MVRARDKKIKVKKAGRVKKSHTDPRRRDSFDEFLFTLPAFLQASDEALYELKKLLTRKHVRRGKAVYLSGDPVTALYIVESGKIEISKTDDQGRRLTLWYITPSELFCVPSVVTGHAIADAEASEDTTLYCLTKTHFDGLLQRFPILAVGLLKCLSGRVRSYSQSVDSVAFNPAASRIAGILLANQADGTKGEMMCSLSRNEIAALAGACRETVSRTLSKFKGEGLITAAHRTIIFRDIDGLKSRYGGKRESPPSSLRAGERRGKGG